MYVELWQMFMFFMVGVSAYFSYRQGRIDGVKSGVQVTITDLHSKGIISIYQDDMNAEMIIGRYDEIEWDEVVDLGEENDEEDHW
jgi:hypothetical protein